MDDLVPFLYQSGTRPDTVRVSMVDEQPWFVAVDVARILGFRDAEHAIRGLDDDEKGTRIVGTLGGEQQLSVISESGLFALVLRSRRPAAKQFRKWVTSEVLPSIRRSGGYGLAGLSDDQCRKIEAVLHPHQQRTLSAVRAIGGGPITLLQLAHLVGLSTENVRRHVLLCAMLGLIDLDAAEDRRLAALAAKLMPGPAPG